jgi:hypothetical protein
MEGKQRKKDVMKRVVSDLQSRKNGCCRITHKQGWLDFLEDGDSVFTPGELRQVLQRVIKENPPRGEKLFCLRKRYCFTVTDERNPSRPEEALERFIVISNPGEYYGQIPIGGGKESIDIGIKEESNKKFIFVELKPWKSNNAPLYAIVESLKNLMEYRFIVDNPDEYKKIQRYKEVDLMVLAPQSYWDDYRVNESGALQKMKRVLNELSAEFGTNISLMVLQIEKDEFLDKCRKICEKRKIDKQDKIRVSDADAIPELARDQWKLLVASDKVSARN